MSQLVERELVRLICAECLPRGERRRRSGDEGGRLRHRFASLVVRRWLDGRRRQRAGGGRWRDDRGADVDVHNRLLPLQFEPLARVHARRRRYQKRRVGRGGLTRCGDRVHATCGQLAHCVPIARRETRADRRRRPRGRPKTTRPNAALQPLAARIEYNRLYWCCGSERAILACCWRQRVVERRGEQVCNRQICSVEFCCHNLRRPLGSLG